MYRLVRPLLFRMDAEAVHERVLSVLQYLPKFLFPNPAEKPVNVMGLEFPHPIGLAAGLDVDGEYLDALAKLGFGFIEIGTVTPKPQQGNPQPRLFRLPKAMALINRMGFNNAGVDALISNVKASHYRGVLGINIGKNKDTSLDRAAEDYLYCFRKVFEHASYVTINISSPNTPELRQLQQGDYFINLMSQLREEQLQLIEKHQRYVPLVIKISPDESDENLKNMANVIVSQGIDGIIATNTSRDHSAVQDLPFGDEIGGVSGQPLVVRSTRCLKVLKAVVGDDVTLIGLGGIDRPRVARDKLKAGASLLQVYTGLIYKGPGLIRTLVRGIL